MTIDILSHEISNLDIIILAISLYIVENLLLLSIYPNYVLTQKVNDEHFRESQDQAKERQKNSLALIATVLAVTSLLGDGFRGDAILVYTLISLSIVFLLIAYIALYFLQYVRHASEAQQLAYSYGLFWFIVALLYTFTGQVSSITSSEGTISIQTSIFILGLFILAIGHFSQFYQIMMGYLEHWYITILGMKDEEFSDRYKSSRIFRSHVKVNKYIVEKLKSRLTMPVLIIIEENNDMEEKWKVKLSQIEGKEEGTPDRHYFKVP